MRPITHSIFIFMVRLINKMMNLLIIHQMKCMTRNIWITVTTNTCLCRIIYGFCIITMHRVMRQWLFVNFWQSIPQAPYSPDMTPCDFFLFNHLKNSLWGSYFDTIDIIKQKSQQVSKNISKHKYERCFQDWIKRWHMCIASHGEYFEGDKYNFDE